MRECGPCSECCYALGVHELPKLDFAHCKHEKSSKKGGCAIYGTRPTSCREFRCLWLAGSFDRKDRPDRIGIVFGTAHMQGTEVVMAWVRKPGADKVGRGQELINMLARQGIPVCISRWDKTKSILVPESMTPLIPMLRRELNAEAVIENGALRRLPVVP